MDPAEALAAPRMHHQWMPDLVNLDVGYPQDVVRGLEARGHTVKVSEHFSAAQVIVWGAEGQMTAASDPRKGGAPAAAR
jgi:gamma-glutamyltranspeptidase/glutathione hydrolase